MTTTITALCRQPPDATAIVRHLAATGHDVTLDDRTTGYLTVRDADDSVLLYIETPGLIHVAGEAGRLLGRAEPELPYWWLDLHVPASAPERALGLANRLAGALMAAVPPKSSDPKRAAHRRDKYT